MPQGGAGIEDIHEGQPGLRHSVVEAVIGRGHMNLSAREASAGGAGGSSTGQCAQ